jgi:hypothetical protein
MASYRKAGSPTRHQVQRVCVPADKSRTWWDCTNLVTQRTIVVKSCQRTATWPKTVPWGSRSGTPR